MMMDDRQERIIAALVQRQFMSVQDVALLLDCSPTSARRHLSALAAAGHIQRTHGGAVALPADLAPPASPSDPFAALKQRIAAAAADLVADSDTVGLSGGSTTLAVARQLRDRRIGAVTNSVEVALDLASGKNSRVMLLGGMLSPITREVVGPEAEDMLAQMSIDRLFLSVEGLSVEAGATCIGTLEAQIMRAMAAQARRVVIVADHRKIGRAALTRILPLTSISMLVTDSYPTPALEAIRRAGVHVIEA